VLVPEGRYYGFPVHTVPGFKFGKYHHLEEIVEPDFYDREPSVDDEELLRQFASKYFPKGAGATMTLKSCMFTNSPDKHFIIDLHPQYPQVSFAAGFTGHGYKFASVVGEVMADLAERRETRHNISLFNLARFTGKVSDLYKEMPGMRVSGRPVSGIAPSIQTGHSRQMHIGNKRRQTRFVRRQDRAGLFTRRQNRHYREGTRSPRNYSKDGYQFIDSTDPRYWEDEDVKPFWL
jgi:hypothetical protein